MPHSLIVVPQKYLRNDSACVRDTFGPHNLFEFDESWMRYFADEKGGAFPGAEIGLVRLSEA